MINHEHKFIFIHIPKCAGSSIKDYYFNFPKLDWRKPNYELLYGWCPKRKIHLQHATSEQLLKLELVQPEIWNSYFKFTFVRNPFDRSYSDYLWVMRDRGVRGSFQDYMERKGAFEEFLKNDSVKEYRGDHLTPQTDFFDMDGDLKMNFIGRFEDLTKDITTLNKKLDFQKTFNVHAKKSKKRKKHYSYFYTKSKRILVEDKYKSDLRLLNYNYEDRKKGIEKIKNLF